MSNFETMADSLSKNISEVQAAVKNADTLEKIDGQRFERTVYLFQSVVKSLIDIGNRIIIENDLRDPLNTADVFISLAEHNMIPLSIVPGVKKAAIAVPKIRALGNQEVLQLIAGCINDMNRCLVSFKKYHRQRNPEDQACP